MFTVQELMDAIKKVEDASKNARTDILFQVVGQGIPLKYQLHWFYTASHGFRYFMDTKCRVYDRQRNRYESLEEADAINK